MTSLVATAGGTRVVSAGHDGSIRVWDPATGECLRTIAGRSGWIHEVAVSPDGRYGVAAGRDASLRRFDLATGVAVDVLTGHTVGADAIAFFPDGRTLLSGGWDKRILVWDGPEEAR